MKLRESIDRKTINLILLALCIVIVATLFVGPFAMAKSVQVQDDFITPSPIANPQTPDEEFFNYRLQFFLPETEPLIKETFGAELCFEDAAFWEYESYYSRAISFATNLPTLAKIEYGPDQNYGMQTEQTESYYYQHLFYLTGLEPGNTYHYRIKIQGSDGAFLVSKDYSFTTSPVPDEVILIPAELPDKSLPYQLTTSNAKYLLTEDIYAPNGGIVIFANNVELDLGGHVISYDNEPNTKTYDDGRGNYVHWVEDHEATYGVKGSTWNRQNQRLYNGTIVQGKNGSSGEYGSGFSPVLFYHGANNTVAGITADYYGDNMSGIAVDDQATVHHNVVYDRGSGIDNRHQGMKAIHAGADSIISYNSVRRSRHFGIVAGGEKYGNEVYSDSFGPNSYLMSFQSNSLCYDNKLFGMGYNPIGIGWYSMSNSVARDNFIYLHAYAPTMRDDEYQRLSGVAGYRPQVYEDNTARADNNLFEHNVIVCKAWPGAAYVRALWVPSDGNMKNTQIRNNIVVAETMTDEIDVSDMYNCFTCLAFQGAAEQANAPEVIFADNLFRTNVNFFVSGTSYGIGFNASFYRNTFEKINHHDSQYWPYRLGFWFWDTTGHKFIDSVEGDGVDLSVPPKGNAYYTEPHYTLSVGVSSDRVYADASTGAPLTGQTIRWQTDGGSEGQFTTDNSGNAYLEWPTTWNEHKPGEPMFVITQTHNSTVTFFADGYEPVTKNIADIKGTGADILFGQSQQPIDKTLVPGGVWGGAYRDAYQMLVNIWSHVAFDGAEIYRSSSANGPFTLIKTEIGTPPYYDSGLSPNTTYYYKVRLTKDGRFGPMSEAVRLTTSDIKVEGIWGGPHKNANTILVNIWGHSVYDGAVIYRSESVNGPFERIFEAAPAPPWYDEGLKPNTVYYYKAQLFKDGHYGPLSDVAVIKTNDVIAEDFRGRANANNIELSWWARSEWDYALIYRSDTLDGTYDFCSQTDTAPFFDHKVTSGKTYYYKICLAQGDHIGALSNAISFTAQ